jgi:hypothetical protein
LVAEQGLAATVFRNRAQEGRKGRGWGGERRGLPVSFVVQHGIENHKELAHAGDEGGLGVLTIGPQSEIESSDSWIAANARHRRRALSLLPRERLFAKLPRTPLIELDALNHHALAKR